jgi:hypothetical protein
MCILHKQNIVPLQHTYDCNGQANYPIKYGREPTGGAGACRQHGQTHLPGDLDSAFKSGKVYQRLWCLLNDAFLPPVAFIKPKSSHFSMRVAYKMCTTSRRAY